MSLHRKARVWKQGQWLDLSYQEVLAQRSLAPEHLPHTSQMGALATASTSGLNPLLYGREGVAGRDLWDQNTPLWEILRDSGVMEDIRGKERKPNVINNK